MVHIPLCLLGLTPVIPNLCFSYCLQRNCTAHVLSAHGRSTGEQGIIFPSYEFLSQLMLPCLLKIFKDPVAAEDVTIGIFAVPWDGALNHVPC